MANIVIKHIEAWIKDIYGCPVFEGMDYKSVDSGEFS